MMETKKRTSYPLGMFDLMKGFGIIQIILRHSVVVPKTNEAIIFIVFAWGFALMGTFYAINGFDTREYSMKKAIQKSTALYLRPYVYVTAIALVLFPVVRTLMYSCLRYFLSETKAFFVTFVLGQYYPIKIGNIETKTVIVVWFFLALFWGTVILNGVLKIKNAKIRHLCILAIALVGILLEENEFGLFCIFRGCQAVPVMYIGHSLKHRNFESRKMHAGDVVLWIVVIVLLSLERIYEYSMKEWHIHTLLRVLLECVLGYYAILISVKTLTWENPFTEVIRKIGRYSYWIMCVHFVEEICIAWFNVPQYFEGHQNLCFVVIVLLRSGIIFAGCMIIKAFNSRMRRKKALKQRRK